MHPYKRRNVRSWCVLFVALGVFGLSAKAEVASSPPDLTTGGERDENHDYLLGPTGARGWIYSQDCLTARSRQILITAVARGSPVDGVLATNDVILGVNDKLFTEDARRSFGQAITAAEENTGVLRLIRWRAGKRANVELKLPVLGAYRDTAPYNCSKSKKIFERGCQFIAKEGLQNPDIPTDLDALALLASGKPEYRPLLARYAKQVAASLHEGTWTWYYGYGNIFLAEYVLATGNRSVMPELKRITQEIALGQGAVGTWGHEFARPDGNLDGYGCMNQTGVPLTISMVLARLAGVNDPVVDRAIKKSATFLRYYVNKGVVPYGDHPPGRNVNEDNGKTSVTGVLFDLLGDREAASFCCRLATAAYDDREHGHTGIFWSYLWALPSVSRCGPLATGAYLKEQSWYYDLARNWQGGFEYQRQPGHDGNDDHYGDWDCTGAYLLSYGLPRKSLYITGKKPSVIPPLTAVEVQTVIAAGRGISGSGHDGYEHRTTAELLAGLSSWSPAMRYRSAEELGKRKANCLAALVRMLRSSDPNARYGACEALAFLGSEADAAAPQLRALLEDPDLWVVSLACQAIAHLGPAARKTCVTELMRLAAKRNPADPRGMVQRFVAHALFSPYPGTREPIVLSGSLRGVDRSLLLPAMRSILQNNDGAARETLGSYYSKLNNQEIAALLPAIVQAVEKWPPSDEMFADGIRQAGLELLSRLHIREGMALCVSTLEWRWGVDFKKRLEYLLRYGVYTKAFLPELRKKRPQNQPDREKIYDQYLAEIEARTNAPPLVSMKEFIAQASASGDASPGPPRRTP